MIFQKKLTEPLLHWAVLKEDYATIEILRENQEALKAENSMGYSALELAQLLGKKACADLLKPSKPKIIKVQPKGSRFNEFTTEQFYDFFDVSYASHLRFKNYQELKTTINNSSWILEKTFLGEDNRDAGAYYREKISQGYLADLTIRWIDDEIGYGAFTNQDLNPKQYVGEYTGMVRRIYRSHPNLNGYCFHYPTRYWSWNYTVIDSLRAGNEMRFINHSDDPNLELLWALDRGLLHLLMLAKKRIPKGSQIFFDYGKDYWRKRRKLYHTRVEIP